MSGELETEQRLRAVKMGIIENIVTMTACAVIVVGLYALGAGGWSAFGFVLLLNLNSFGGNE